jgi:hypothetical protein
MEKAKRARKAETPRQPSLCLRLRAPYLYPDPTATVSTNQAGGYDRFGLPAPFSPVTCARFRGVFDRRLVGVAGAHGLRMTPGYGLCC